MENLLIIIVLTINKQPGNDVCRVDVFGEFNLF